ncbi:hypothetical protein G7066_12635 [Leucobacter coleopterorum]|uniref:Uncharacterized protein n=1 Tax=Leucobacter coleopterorum TaxID=2714933 RepID=A0ABX6JYA5_9MICO|nr:hypothetical protein [Leucobacter coleopterorum]QIM19203.1 hypothetical protein G7066_12635 [Leucobacter coleopterorum]
MQSMQHTSTGDGRIRRFGRFAAVAAIIMGLLVIPAAAQAGFNDDYEGYRVSTLFDVGNGTTAGVVSASGDYAAYIANYNSVVIRHFTGPGDDDWETATLTPPPTMQGTFARRVVVDAANGRAVVTPNPKNYVKAGGFSETTAEVYVYRLSGTNTWTYEKTLTVDEPVGAENRASFGLRLEVSGDVAAVSAESAVRASGIGNGAVYLINLVTGDWARVEHNLASTNEEFGMSTAFNGTKLAVASPMPVSTCDRYGTGVADTCRLGKVTLFDVSGVQATNPRVIQNPMDPKTFHPSGVTTDPFSTVLKFAEGKLFVSSSQEINFTSDDPLILLAVSTRVRSTPAQQLRVPFTSLMT